MMINWPKQASKWTNRKLNAVDFKLIILGVLLWTQTAYSLQGDKYVLKKKNLDFANQANLLRTHDNHLSPLCETERTTRHFHQLHDPVSSTVFFHPSHYHEIKCKSLTDITFRHGRTLSDSNNNGTCSRLYHGYPDRNGQMRAVHARLGCVQRFQVVPYWIVKETDSYNSDSTSTYLSTHLQFNFTSAIVPYGCECLPLTTS